MLGGATSASVLGTCTGRVDTETVNDLLLVGLQLCPGALVMLKPGADLGCGASHVLCVPLGPSLRLKGVCTQRVLGGQGLSLLLGRQRGARAFPSRDQGCGVPLQPEGRPAHSAPPRPGSAHSCGHLLGSDAELLLSRGWALTTVFKVLCGGQKPFLVPSGLRTSHCPAASWTGDTDGHCKLHSGTWGQ